VAAGGGAEAGGVCGELLGALNFLPRKKANTRKYFRAVAQAFLPAIFRTTKYTKHTKDN
jgi:hypothetical protein